MSKIWTGLRQCCGALQCGIEGELSEGGQAKLVGVMGAEDVEAPISGWLGYFFRTKENAARAAAASKPNEGSGTGFSTMKARGPGSLVLTDLGTPA
jgi:hypothetical protein